MSEEKKELSECSYFRYDWMDEMTLDMLPQGLPYQIAKEIGIENYMKLAKLVGGDRIYIPRFESLIRPVRDKKMKEEFNGYNHRKLAKKYGLTEIWVTQICGVGCMQGQQTLFDSVNLRGKDVK